VSKGLLDNFDSLCDMVLLSRSTEKNSNYGGVCRFQPEVSSRGPAGRSQELQLSWLLSIVACQFAPNL
jgi:hypothetical protein